MDTCLDAPAHLHARCPACDSFFGLLPDAGHSGWEHATLREWSRLGSSTLMCLGCWTPLRAGHRVLLRRRPLAAPCEVAEGDEGEVLQVLGRGLLMVRFEAAEFALTRDCLTYVQGQAAHHGAPPVPQLAQPRSRRVATA